MFIIKFLYCIFNNISKFLKMLINSNEVIKIPQVSEARLENELEKEIVKTEKEVSETEKYKQINLSKRILLNKLYLIEQKVDLFKEDFPNEYNYFFGEIEKLRNFYKLSLEEEDKTLTLKVDPEFNGELIWKIEELDSKITLFIEKNIKFEIFSQKFQKLIVKLNILYNVSILHSNEKEKVIAQTKKALEVEMEFVQELKNCVHIFSDRYLKERIITLISYTDYHIFKIILRNSKYSIQEILAHLVIINQFKGFDYISAFNGFMQDEISDLNELLDLISNPNYHKEFDKNIKYIKNQIFCDKEMQSCVLDEGIWREIFKIESNLIEFLKNQKVDNEDKIKVKIIDRMKIRVREDDVITSPKTNAYLALIEIFSISHDDRIWILIKLWENISKNITYKEIYFLLLLFDVTDVIKNTSNILYRQLEKYFVKYPYDKATINRKKIYVMNSNVQKKYVKILSLIEQRDKIISILKNLNMDFKIENDGIYINTFYFKGLKEVFI